MASLNVNGLKSPSKRRILFDHLRQSRADLCLLQETHCTPGTEKLWKQEWGGKGFFAHGAPNSRGVAILLGRNLDLQITKNITDEDGRYVFIEFLIDEITYTVGCLYAPTQDRRADQLAFIETIDEQMSNLDSTNLILGGDYNCCLHPVLDRNKEPTTTSNSSDTVRQKILTWMDDWNLTDIWRIRNPNSRGTPSDVVLMHQG